MKAIVLFFVVVLAISAEAAVRGRSHKSQTKAATDEPAAAAAEESEGEGEGDEEWPQPSSIKSFSGNGDISGHAALESSDHGKSSRGHGREGRKSHSH